MVNEDPVTRLFTPHGTYDEQVLDVSLGAVRGVPLLSELLATADLSRVLDGIDRYPGTQGSTDLLDGFSDLRYLEHGERITPDHFVATSGALDALGHAIAATESQRVLYPTPGFQVGLAAARAGAVGHPIHWEVGAEVSELLAQLEMALSRSGDKSAVVVNFPANPSGAQPTTEQWAELIDITASAHSTLIVDDVYAFSGTSGVRPDLMADHVILVDSMSKRLGVPGLRLGYATTGERLLSPLRASVARSSVGIARPVAILGAQLLKRYCENPAIAESVRSILSQRRRDLRAAAISAEGVRFGSTGGIYECVLVDDAEQGARMSDWLMEHSRIRVAVGSSLADPRTSPQAFLRVCVGSSVDPIRVGRAISDAMVALKLQKTLI